MRAGNRVNLIPIDHPLKRTIFIGDIQGCLDELLALVEKLRLSPRDRVICLGDLINRGPYSKETVRYVYDRGFDSLMGNHDEHYRLHWREFPRYKTIKKHLGNTVHQWYTQRPLHIETSEFIAVHAGIEPGKKVTNSRRECLLRIRNWDGKGKNMNNSANPPWYRFYRGKKKVIYGHWAQQGLHLGNRVMGLDTGCVWGGYLTALVWETQQIYQVPARKKYSRY